MSNFRVGQKVVCVDDENFAVYRLYGPVKGEIYTVSGFSDKGNLRIKEMDQRSSYFPRRFRPVVERKTDISIFTRILDSINEKRSERV